MSDPGRPRGSEVTEPSRSQGRRRLPGLTRLDASAASENEEGRQPVSRPGDEAARPAPPPGVPAEIAEEVAAADVGAVVPPDRPVAFVGLMASGKTSLGKRVAAALGIAFIDADREIERRTGRTIPEIFAADGEAAFRAIEEQVIAELVTEPTVRVIATGGGAVLSEANRRHLHTSATVVWLRATPGILAGRVKPDDSRPLLATDPRGTLERLSIERAALYGEVAHHVIDVDGGDRRVLLRQVLAAVCPAPAPSEEPAR
jgi:shikimate kinase